MHADAKLEPQATTPYYSLKVLR